MSETVYQVQQSDANRFSAIVNGGGRFLSSAGPCPDSELLRLGALLDAAYAREAPAWEAAGIECDDNGPMTLLAQKLASETSEIVHEIVDVPATTLAGLGVKLRAIVACRGSDPFPDPGEARSTETVVLTGLLNDLAAMTKMA